MTKEELLNKKFSIVDFGERKDALYFNDLMSFFESNVVIPKGKNRHKLADIIHAFAEGSVVECKTKGFFQEYVWATYSAFNFDLEDPKTEVRIKPSEPVYEWQWLIKGTSVYYLSDYHTDEEASYAEYTKVGHKKIEETKRERK